MRDNIKKEDFGYDAKILDTFFDQNDFIPKGTFQIKKEVQGIIGIIH